MIKLLVSSALIIVTMLLFAAVDRQIARIKGSDESVESALILKVRLALTTLAALVCLAAVAVVVIEH